MKKFEFNEFDVCLNPLVEVIYRDRKLFAIIMLAEKNGEWAYGYDFGIKGMSVGHFRASSLPGFSVYRKEKFLSKEAARTKAIDFGLECFKMKMHLKPEPVINALKQALTPQLSLF